MSEQLRLAAFSSKETEPAVSGLDDAALWREVASTKDLHRFSQAWLAILARSAGNIQRACALIGTVESRAPTAVWARGGLTIEADRFLADAEPILSAVVRTQQPAVESANGAGSVVHAGIPLILDETLHGAVLVEAELSDLAASRRLIRHLQWGAAWVEAFLRRDRSGGDTVVADRARLLIDIVNAVVSQPGCEAASHAFVEVLARHLACDRVAVGYRGSRSTRLVSLLQTATFERKYELGRAIEAAMDEAIDQRMVLSAPPPGNARYSAMAQQQLARLTAASAVVSVPMFRHDVAIGAVTLERFKEGLPSEEQIEVCEALCAAVGPILADKREKDRSIVTLTTERLRRSLAELIGPRHLGIKIAAVLALAPIVYVSFATDTYRVSAHAEMQGEVRRVLSVPFDGYIRSQYLRAGQVAESGALLAEMQDNDLVLDRLRHVAQRNQYRLELDRALGKRDLAQANVARAQIEQQDAEIELADQTLARTQIRAPFASVVVSGDLSQSIGKPVSRGDTLFELAPLDRYRVTLLVPELEIQAVVPGQRGSILLTALPERPFSFEVTTVTPVSHVQDGLNGFEVHAVLRENDPRVRPGMEGVAKIEVGERNVAWIWIHGLVHWVRIKLWAWLP
jgi:hypothetical protein